VPAGINIYRCAKDLGPATKVLPCARDLRGRSANIIFCDDDRIYASGWAAALLAAKAHHDDCAICVIGWSVDHWGNSTRRSSRHTKASFRPRWADWEYRRRRILQQFSARKVLPLRYKPPRWPIAQSGMVDVFGGYGGVLVEPDWFANWAFDIPRSFWSVDDIWLSGCLARQGIGIWAEANLELAPASEADRTDALFRKTIDGENRQALNRKGITYLRDTYSIWT
jgi:hypothetical protein